MKTKNASERRLIGWGIKTEFDNAEILSNES
jgi:hypothetical protein